MAALAAWPFRRDPAWWAGLAAGGAGPAALAWARERRLPRGPLWAPAPAPPPPRAPTLFVRVPASQRGASGQDAGQPGAQLCLVVGLRPEPQPCAQQVRLAARHVGRLQPERQPVGLHATFRGTAAASGGAALPVSLEALALESSADLFRTVACLLWLS